MNINMNLKENISTQLKRRTHLLDRVIDNLLPNMYPCDYNSSEHFVEGVLDEIRWFLVDVEELRGVERTDIDDYIFDYKYDELTNYFNEKCIVLNNDNLKESITRILREETNPTIRRIYRRADPDKVDKIFKDGLDTMTTRYIQNQHNWHAMNLDKFKSGIVSYVIVDLCVKYSDICYGAGDFYNQVWEFLLSHYSDVMEERWNEIMSGEINESVIKENKVENLVKKYLSEFGLTKTSEMMGISLSKVVEIAKIPIDSDIANQILVEMMNKGELKNKYKEFEIHSSSNNVFYWEAMTSTGHFHDDMVENITVAATPFWDGVKYTPVEIEWFTLLNEYGDIVYEISPEGGFYRELKHQTNFESVDELLNWYEEFYLPEVYNMVMNTLLPKMHKLVDYEIKQRG